MNEINRKIMLIFASLFIVSMMLTPLAIAKPGVEKSNEKFEYFELVCSGAGDETFDSFWYTPPNADILDNKTTHMRGGGWVTGATVELTVGDKTFDMESTTYSVDWTTKYDANVIRFNNGSAKQTVIMLTDILTLYNGEEDIGTLVLNLKAKIDSTVVPPGYGGTMQGYGTGVLEGVHVSGIDLGLVSVPPPIFMRTGTITGWPEQITNTIS